MIYLMLINGERKTFKLITAFFIASIMIVIGLSPMIFQTDNNEIIRTESMTSNEDMFSMIVVDTTWSKVDSPYVVSDNVTVGIGVCLTIEAGVEIRFEQGRELAVDGELAIQGTEAEPILFTSNESVPAPGDWESIRFRDNAVDFVNFSNAIIEYAVTGLVADRAAPLVGNCVVRHCASEGLLFLDVQNNLEVSGNLLEQNGGDGLRVQNCWNLDITGNTIQDNGMSGISLGWMDITRISGNIIQNNAGPGINFSSSGWAELTIQSNIIMNNMDSGIHNTNEWDDWTRPTSIKYNTFQNNAPYDIKGGKGNIDATDNWWSTQDTGIIQGKIFDYYDDTNFGLISWSPILTGPAPRLTDYGVEPPGGNTSTIFHFFAIYEDGTDEMPDSVELNIIDNWFWPPQITTHQMLESDVLDVSTADGKEYYFDLQITVPKDIEYNFTICKGNLTMVMENRNLHIVVGPLDHIMVGPDIMYLNVGETMNINPEGRDVFDNNIGDLVFNYAINNSLVTVQNDPWGGKMVSAGSIVGQSEINISCQGIFVIVSVFVQPGEAQTLTMSPMNVDVQIGENIEFTAEAYDLYGNLIPPVTTYDWGEENNYWWDCWTEWDMPWLGDLEQNGTQATLHTSFQATEGWVRVNCDGMSVEANVTTNPGPIWEVQIEPGWLDMDLMTSKIFTAIARDEHWNEIDNVSYEWFLDNGIGTLNSTIGKYVNYSAGTISGDEQIRVVCNGVESWINVFIKPGPMHHIATDPEEIIIGAGQWINMNAQGRDEYDNKVDYWNFQWIADPELGWLSNTNGDWNDLNTASTPTNGTITVSDGGNISTNISVTIIAGPLDRLEIAQDWYDIQVGETLELGVMGTDMFGNPIDGLNYTWNISGDGGNLDMTDGQFVNFTANTQPGWSEIRINCDWMERWININVNPGELETIQIDPPITEIMVGDWCDFRAVGLDIYGNEVNLWDYNWNITGDIGWIDSTVGDWTHFNAASVPGNGSLTVSYGELNTSLYIDVVVGPVEWLTMTPNCFKMDVNTTQILEAAAYDMFGNPVENSNFTWSFYLGEELGTLDANQSNLVNFTAGTEPGYVILNVMADGRNFMCAIAVIPGELATIEVDPPVIDMEVGQWVDLKANGLDEFGNELTWMEMPYIDDPGMPIPPMPSWPDYNLDFQWTLYGDIGWLSNDRGQWNGFGADSQPGIGYIDIGLDGVNQTVNITLNVGPFDHMDVLPWESLIRVNETKTFKAQAYDRYHNPIDGMEYSWELVGEGQISNISGQEIVYSAPLVPGYVLLNVSCQDVFNWACIAILPGELDYISVDPIELQTEVGWWENLHATGYDEFGNQVNYIPPMPYTEPSDDGKMPPGPPPFPDLYHEFDWNFTGDVGILQNDLGEWADFEAFGKPGSGVINVSYDKIFTLVPVTVDVGPLEWIEISPDDHISIEVGQNINITALAYDHYGNFLDNAGINWTLENNLSTISILNETTRTITAGTVPGWTELIISFDRMEWWVGIEIMPGPLHALVLEPANITISAVEPVHFGISGYDIFGNHVEFWPVWTAEAGFINEDGYYEPDPMSNGTFLINAEDQGIVGTATVTVNYDSDLDGLPDWWEYECGLDIYYANALEDLDEGGFGDGLTNMQEYLNGTSPTSGDSDSDGLGDGVELIIYGTDPMNWDTDHNGMSDGLDVAFKADMNTLPGGWISMTIQWDIYTMEVATSSGVLEVSFDKYAKKLSIMVGGPSGTSGETHISVPVGLVNHSAEIVVGFDGEVFNNYTITNNGTHYLVNITYSHSTHELTTDFDGTKNASVLDSVGNSSMLMLVGIAVFIACLVTVSLIKARKARDKNREAS